MIDRHPTVATHGAGDTAEETAVLIDCATCIARDVACGDCVVTALLGPPVPARSDPWGSVELDESERAALASLAGAGLVPPLRLVRAMPEAGIRESA